jgi:toxin FitB
MYLVDTNIISLLDPRRQTQSPGLVPWLRRNGAYLFLSAITLTELEAGILKLRREGKEKRAGELGSLRDAIQDDFSDRILPLDASAALAIARLSERARPNTIDLADLIIAATAHVHGLRVLTRNLRHIRPTGVPAIDPTAELPEDVAP